MAAQKDDPQTRNLSVAPLIGAESNAKFIADAKKVDFSRQTTTDQRDALGEKPVSKTLAGGTKVIGPKSAVDRLA